MSLLPNARPPRDERLYAIGDVHGYLDALTAMHRRIEWDLMQHPARRWRVIHLGDYIDRGPRSADVLELLHRRSADPHFKCIRGNHDQYLADFLADPETPSLHAWMRNGGTATLASFGVGGDTSTRKGRARLWTALTRRMGPELVRWVAEMPHLLLAGGYAFAHAGVRPGLPLVQQDPADLMWIRDDFLGSTADHGAVVVHGHSVSAEIELRPNRIGIDTGAVHGGRLSCVVLEGCDVSELTPEGRRPLLPQRERASVAA